MLSKRADELKGKCSRHTRRCFVIGASGSGKVRPVLAACLCRGWRNTDACDAAPKLPAVQSALVSGCLRRIPPPEYKPTTDVQHSAVNVDEHCTVV